VEVVAIGPELAATIMFLIADRVADAAQMSRSIRFDTTTTVEDQLRHAIADLARGNLDAVRSNTWQPPATEDSGSDVDAVNLLWWRLLQGLRILATDLRAALFNGLSSWRGLQKPAQKLEESITIQQGRTEERQLDLKQRCLSLGPSPGLLHSSPDVGSSL
jgi:hypothetical protein